MFIKKTPLFLVIFLSIGLIGCSLEEDHSRPEHNNVEVVGISKTVSPDLTKEPSVVVLKLRSINGSPTRGRVIFTVYETAEKKIIREMDSTNFQIETSYLGYATLHFYSISTKEEFKHFSYKVYP